MRKTFLALIAAAALAGCATPPPPAPGSAASKVVTMGKLSDIDIGPMRVARENGFMTVKASLTNTSRSNRTMYYRFAWLGNDGFPVAAEESWKTVTLYGKQATVLPAIAPVPQATDFRIEVQTQ
ncbi:YcfL family protein [Pseudomonas capeferrum]|uniref:YcfL family protein n=1 Tax=Pseudomonas capeferrum TaxID=1495066 RepID=UPI0015E37023|nr:YcfL family protein [Pseudomonas capeferrum]MBA1201527.1 YcfL family protein [Pseudomonas capeferrum]